MSILTPEHLETIRELAKAANDLPDATHMVITLRAALDETVKEIDRMRGNGIPLMVLTDVRDNLRQMYQQWHTRGPHASEDSPTIEHAILAMDTMLKHIK